LFFFVDAIRTKLGARRQMGEEYFIPKGDHRRVTVGFGEGEIENCVIVTQ
jgi:hypothetical protein